MFDKTKVIQELTGLVGYDNPTNPDYDIVDATNQIATSGRKVTDHPMCKVEFLYDTQDYKGISDVNFNTFLTNLINNSISNILDQVFDVPDYIDRQMLFNYPNNKQQTDDLPSGFVGYEICQSLEKNMCFEIRRDILSFDGTGNVKLLLFNSEQSTPLFSKEIAVTSSNQEVELNWKVDNTGTYYKGKFYYGYITSGVTIKPFKREYENANVKSLITFMEFDNIKVPGVTTEVLFDLEDVDGADETWGLNPDVQVYYDYTDLIKQNQRLFAKGIQIQAQIDCMKHVMASLRSNANQRIGNEMLSKMLLEIEGAEFEDGLKKVGMKYELMGEMNRVRKEINKLKKGYWSSGINVITLT